MSVLPESDRIVAARNGQRVWACRDASLPTLLSTLLSKLLLALVLLVGGQQALAAGVDQRSTIQINMNSKVEPISPLPVQSPVDPARRELGRQLFFDQRLSDDGLSSCASCHPLPPIDPQSTAQSSAMTRSTIQGTYKRATTLLYNVSYLYWLDWDGRYSKLERLIGDAITDVDKLNNQWLPLLAMLGGSYNAQTNQIYGTDLSQAVIEDAIATFLRSLNTPNSALDRYLLGDQEALTERQRQGYALFKQVGCSSCHNGRNIGGNFFEHLYVYRYNVSSRSAPNIILKDLGRYYVSGEEPDRNIFRVSPLRNVALSAPYFHNGSAATLADATRMMADHQLGRTLTTEQVELLVEFMHALTGEHPGVEAPVSMTGEADR